MTTLYIIQGFLGAGKTTYSLKLAKEVNAIRYNADEWVMRDFCHQQQLDDWEECFAKATRAIWVEAEKAVKLNKQSVILDFGFWTRESRMFAKHKAAEWDIQFKHYYLYVPDEILIERINKRTGPIADQNLKNFYKYKSIFEEPLSSEEFIKIDNY